MVQIHTPKLGIAGGSRLPICCVSGWNTSATREQFLQEFKDFHPRYRSVIEQVDGPIMLFQMRTVPPLPTWVNGRVALLGDAAHATLPSEFKPELKD